MRKLKNINLEDLVDQGIIDLPTAQKIETYYINQAADAPNRVSLVFGVIGAALIGLGIMLIFAHNWDNFSRPIKTFLAVLPMLIGQIACGYTLLKQKDQQGWREASATFLFFAVGGCIAMVSQIYNLEGELGSFLLTWMLLCLPLIYVMQSSIVSLLYIGGVTWYGTNMGYENRNEPYFFWVLLAAALPHYYQLYKNRPTGNAFNYHSWAIALSVLGTLGLWSLNAPVLMWVAYVTLLSVYFLIGNLPFFRTKKTANNPFLLIGIIGTILFFLIFTFVGFWEDLLRKDMGWVDAIISQEFFISTVLALSAFYLLVKLRFFQNIEKITPLPLGFLVFLLVYVLGYNYPMMGMVLSNLLVLAIGIFYIYRGNQLQNLGVLNLGLLTLAALITCRFFDMDMSFVTRGILFVLVGIAFFVANYRLLQQRKVLKKR